MLIDLTTRVSESQTGETLRLHVQCKVWHMHKLRHILGQLVHISDVFVCLGRLRDGYRDRSRQFSNRYRKVANMVHENRSDNRCNW